MKFNTRLIPILVMMVIGMLCLTSANRASAAPTFVGKFQVDGGMHEYDPGYLSNPYQWTNNPPVFSGQEAAALLFGGVPGDYWISVDPSADPLSITHTAHYDGWAEPDTIFAEGFHFDTPPAGYNDPAGLGTAWSAYVLDHDDDNWNYVWKPDGVAGPGDLPTVPEPCSMALLGLGGIPLFGKLRLRQRQRFAI